MEKGRRVQVTEKVSSTLSKSEISVSNRQYENTVGRINRGQKLEITFEYVVHTLRYIFICFPI